MNGAGSVYHPEIPLPPDWPPLVTYECERCRETKRVRGDPAPVTGWPLWFYDEPERCDCGGQMWAQSTEGE